MCSNLLFSVCSDISSRLRIPSDLNSGCHPDQQSCISNLGSNAASSARPVGLMDKASASGAGDSRFESWAGHTFCGRWPWKFTHPFSSDAHWRNAVLELLATTRPLQLSGRRQSCKLKVLDSFPGLFLMLPYSVGAVRAPCCRVICIARPRFSNRTIGPCTELGQKFALPAAHDAPNADGHMV